MLSENECMPAFTRLLRPAIVSVLPQRIQPRRPMTSVDECRDIVRR